MANCCNCSAPLPPNTITCEYCGSRNDVDLAGIHYYTTHRPDSERTCPRCHTELKTIDLKGSGSFLIERCDQCLGLFFDPGELEALLEATVSNVYTVNKSQLDSIASRRSLDYGVSYVKCPVCSNVMNRVNFGAKSGVVLDRCKEHGLWVDGGELRHLFEWMKAGGKLLDQERKEQEKQEAARLERKERRRKEQADLGISYDQGFDSYGSVLRQQDPDLFSLVRQALQFFLR